MHFFDFTSSYDSCYYLIHTAPSTINDHQSTIKHQTIPIDTTSTMSSPNNQKTRSGSGDVGHKVRITSRSL
jgi:hypothetical protein